MKIHSLQISNALSFQYHENFDNAQEILFDKNLNILIGPNGSGKSNFLEILSEILKKGVFRDCTIGYGEAIFFNKNKKDKDQNRFTEAAKQKKYNFSKNKLSREKPLKIKIKIELTEHDISNLLFIISHSNEIESMLHEFYYIASNFREVSSNEIQNMEKTIELIFEDPADNGFLTRTNTLEKENSLVTQYLLFFEYIQNCIHIGNQLENKNWEELKNPFALLGSNRDYNQFTSELRLSDDRQGEIYRNTRSNLFQTSIKTISGNEPASFLYVRYFIALIYNNIREDLASGNLPNPDQKHAKEFLKNDPMFKKLNEYLEKYLKFTLEVDKPNPNLPDYEFYFKDSLENIIPILELSSGEKGIIHLIFTIFGFDLKNGVVIIDEPEIHIHPQMQKKYLKIIQDSIDELNLQFIIATHSPIFVSPKTISYLHRFHIDDGYTKTVQPEIEESEKDLITILDYTNSSKIFFVNNVILVEGPTDEYFYKLFLQKYKGDFENSEFLDIGGKKSHPMWKKFLLKYGIKNYFIGDLDNIFSKEFEIIDSEEETRIKSNFRETLEFQNKNTQDAEYDNSREFRIDLIRHLKNNEIEKWQEIEPKITSKYSDEIYILKEGEIEDYLQIQGRKNKFEKIINFCKNDFNTWYSTPVNEPKINELKGIFDSIVS